MADTTVTDINTIATDGSSSGKYSRSTTPASDGTAVASADVAVIPAFNPKTDTILLAVSAASPVITISANSANRFGRTNAMTWTGATGQIEVIPPGAIPDEIFKQSDGSLRISVASGNIYVTVLRCPVG